MNRPPRSDKDKPMKLNADWHAHNRMPARATLEQRIAWHVEHAKHCACRPTPEKLRDEIRRREGPKDE